LLATNNTSVSCSWLEHSSWSHFLSF
jgi:hypothetical protein